MFLIYNLQTSRIPTPYSRSPVPRRRGAGNDIASLGCRVNRDTEEYGAIVCGQRCIEIGAVMVDFSASEYGD